MKRRGKPCRALPVLAVLAWAAPAGAELTAARIDAGNAERLLIGGPDAIGGIGDWYLANDRVEVIVDDPARSFATLNHGGTLVDAGVVGRRGADQFARIFPLVNLDQRVQLGYDEARTELDPEGRFARVVVTSRRGMSSVPRGGALARALDPLVPESAEIADVHPETVYEVRPGEPFVRITTTIHNRGASEAPVFAYGDVWMRGGRGMRSFVGNTRELAHASGFHHRDFDRSAILSSGGAMAAQSFVAMAGVPPYPSVAYALASPERAAEGRLQFGVTGKHVTLVNVFVADAGWQEVGVLRVLGATRAGLPAGGSFRFERRLWILPGADVASLTDEIFPALGFADGASGVEGSIEPAPARVAVHVETPDGHPVTQILTGGSAGRYRAALPPGPYALVLYTEQGETRRLELEVPAGRFAQAPLQRFAEPAWLEFAPAFADGGPGRVIVRGLGDTPTPIFQPELLDFRIDGKRVGSGVETRELAFVGGDTDPRRVAVPPGRYRLVATRGPEFGVAEAEVMLAGPGDRARVPPFELARVVALRGVVSADLHVHAAASDDSGMSNEARLAGYVAEHVDVMVSTDHDHLGWFEPALDALGVRGRVRVVQGVEVTGSAPSLAAPWTSGHHNAWPVEYQALAHRRGAPPSQGFGVADLYASLRRESGARVVQLNHALPGAGAADDGHFFSHLGTAGEPYDPALPLSDWPNRLLLEPGSDGATRAVDFDAMEVMNGDGFAQYERLREVWYSLLAQGYRRTATGNSDSHGPGEIAAYPRNYVYVDGDFDAERFDAAVRDGRLFATTGPLIAGFRAGGARMGDIAPAPGGALVVELAVAAAPWVPVDEVRLLVNGEVARRFAGLGGSRETLRLDERVELALARDAFLTVEAGVALGTDARRWSEEQGGVYALVAPGFVPQAISNPIWVDVDGDGSIAPVRVADDGASPASRQLRSWLMLVLAMAVVWWWLRRRAGLAPTG